MAQDEHRTVDRDQIVQSLKNSLKDILLYVSQIHQKVTGAF